MSLFVKKPLEQLLAASTEKGLKRTLGAGNLIALGIGAIIGAGLFVRTAAAAGQAAGPCCYHIIYHCCCRLRFRGALLCRVCLDDSCCG
jgi:amino acid permease